MRTNKDARGRSYFDIFASLKGQVDVSVNYPGTIRAFHQHLKKDETWFVASGEFKVFLTDPVEIIYLSEGESIFIERKRWHGFQVLGNKMGIMIEYTTRKHMDNPTDDYRREWNAFHNWEVERK